MYTNIHVHEYSNKTLRKNERQSNTTQVRRSSMLLCRCMCMYMSLRQHFFKSCTSGGTETHTLCILGVMLYIPTSLPATHTCTCTCTKPCPQLVELPYMYMYMYVHVYVCTCICMYMCTCTCTCTCTNYISPFLFN